MHRRAELAELVLRRLEVPVDPALVADVERDQQREHRDGGGAEQRVGDQQPPRGCLLYTTDAADERSSVDLGGRRILKKKKI